MKAKKRSPLWELQNREDKSGFCQMCKKFSDYLTVDHIFPISLLQRFGLTECGWKDEENLELICKPCNVLKKDRFDFNNPKTIPLIKHYLELLTETYEPNRKKLDNRNGKN